MNESRRDPARACDLLHATEQWADLVIRTKNREHAKGKKRGWERWVSKQMAEGGGGTSTGVEASAACDSTSMPVRCGR